MKATTLSIHESFSKNTLKLNVINNLSIFDSIYPETSIKADYLKLQSNANTNKNDATQGIPINTFIKLDSKTPTNTIYHENQDEVK